jgi:hypothetical protein
MFNSHHLRKDKTKGTTRRAASVAEAEKKPRE